MLLNKRTDYYKMLAEINGDCTEEQKSSVMRDLCLNDLFFLLVYGCGRLDADKEWLFQRCREVQSNPDDMLDLWAREHYKSTVITFALTIQDILNNPEITIGIFSHTRPNAKGFLRQIKREFELNANLKNWFKDILYDNPAKQAIKWSEDDGIIVKRETNPKESTVEAWGVVDGQPTGKHFGLLVYDDIVTKESVTTPDMIEKTTDALALSYNLGAHGGRRRFIGTRYHFADTYKTIMDRGTVTPRIYPATHDGSLTGNPVFLTQEQNSNKRRDMGIYVYSCQMLQNPVADSSQGFDRSWMQYFDGMPPEECVWYLLVDAANGKRKSNDFTSMWAVGLGSDNNYYCIPEVRDRLNLTERANRLIDLHRKYKPVEVRYERYGMMADINFIMVKQEQIGYRFPIIEVAGPTSKIDRIKRLVPLFEDSKIFMPRTRIVTDYEGKSRDLVRDFIEEECVPFPVPLHDDMLDSLARITEQEGTKHGQDKKIDLKLQWPQKKKPKSPVMSPFRPSVPGLGY
jgi:predicted phage terminase large subunit-like protein